MNDKKFSIIIAKNSDLYFNEAKFYIERLQIPQGYVLDVIPVEGAKSLAAAYNKGMVRSDAKYKVYMHQDVSILNPHFLYDLLTVFEQDEEIGVVGLVGAPKISESGVPWYADQIGNMYAIDNANVQFGGYAFRPEDCYTEVDCVEGFLMATSRDLKWRDDLFDGWCYAEMAQCLEFRNHGYKIVVPVQRKPWAAHDNGITSIFSGYNTYRKILLENYAKFF